MKNFSRIFLIFDEDINVNSFQKELSKTSPETIDLFPVTSNWRLIFKIEDTIRSLFGAEIEIKLNESAELINKEVDTIRERVSSWSANLANTNIAGKSLKDWFLLPKTEVSTWWFSLLSEKNPLKTNVFFRLGQLQTIDKIISLKLSDSCFVSVRDKTFLISIKKICKKHSLKIFHISSLKRKKALMEKIKSYLNRQNALAFTLKGLIHYSIRISRGIRAKLIMGSIKNRVKVHKNSILLVSYFPAVDMKSAKEGILKNKYTLSLQKKLLEMNKKIIWIWMYVFMDGHSYNDALILAKKFTKSGEDNFFLEEFISFKVAFRVLILWIRQVRIFLMLKKLIPTHILNESLSIPEGSIFIKNLMARSFIGWTGLAGILFYELYKEVFSHFSFPTHCIYYLEMQAWEKALNAAKQLKSSQVKTIGFQHGAIFKNHFSYFHHPSEMAHDKNSKLLPLPDILGCNGNIPFHLMSSSGYRNITKLEAIRHLYLANLLRNVDFSRKQNIVLIVCSIDKQETKALISLFHEAFPKPKKFKVWIKRHPTFPLDTILKDLRVDIRNCRYTLQNDSLDKLLESVKILIVGSSTSVIEGLAAGCKIIAPIFSNNMFISPLEGFEDFYIKVHNPQELRSSIEQIIQNNEAEQNFDEVIKFVNQYWCLDPSLKRWEELLSSQQ